MRERLEGNAFSSWVAVHEVKAPAIFLLLSGAAGLLITGSGISTLGMITLPETVPYWLLLPTLWGVLCGNLLHYRGPHHVISQMGKPARLVAARSSWFLLVFLLTACCCLIVAATEQTAILLVMVTNLALFFGLTLAVVLAGFPQLSWLIPAALTLVAMGFGFPEDSGDDEWYPWATFLSPELSAGRSAVSWSILGVTVLSYIAFGTRPSRNQSAG